MSAATRPFPRKCATCRERTVSPTVLPTYAAELEHDGRAYQVTIPEVPVLQCSHCGAIVLVDAAEQLLSAALRHQAGLLTPSQIRQDRERLGLTQKEIATALRISESTVSRWETGAQMQQRSMDLLLRAFFELEPLRHYCGIRKPTLQRPDVIPSIPQAVSAGPAGTWNPFHETAAPQPMRQSNPILNSPAPGTVPDGRDPKLAS